MAGRTEYVGLRLRESVDKIEAWQRTVETAILDARMDELNRNSFDAAI
jgi:hypothetical protein